MSKSVKINIKYRFEKIINRLPYHLKNSYQISDYHGHVVVVIVVLFAASFFIGERLERRSKSFIFIKQIVMMLMP